MLISIKKLSQSRVISEVYILLSSKEVIVVESKASCIRIIYIKEKIDPFTYIGISMMNY